VKHLLTWLRAQWDRAAAVALLVLGGILVIAGYAGVSGADRVDDQLSYLASGGVAGLFCLGLGASLLISANLGDEWRKLDELVKAVRETGTGAADVDVSEPLSAVPVEVDARTPEAPGEEPSARVRAAGRAGA
jgi:hypothetical protein